MLYSLLLVSKWKDNHGLKSVPLFFYYKWPHFCIFLCVCLLLKINFRCLSLQEGRDFVCVWFLIDHYLPLALEPFATRHLALPVPFPLMFPSLFFEKTCTKLVLGEDSPSPGRALPWALRAALTLQLQPPACSCPVGKWTAVVFRDLRLTVLEDSLLWFCPLHSPLRT